MKRNKILLIDDNKLISMAIDLILDKEEYELCHATTIKSGINILEKQDFDIVLLDLMIPSENSIAAIEKIRKNYTEKVIVISAVNSPDAIREAFKRGACDYIVKPFEKNDFILSLKKALEKSHQQLSRAK